MPVPALRHELESGDWLAGAAVGAETESECPCLSDGRCELNHARAHPFSNDQGRLTRRCFSLSSFPLGPSTVLGRKSTVR